MDVIKEGMRKGAEAVEVFEISARMRQFYPADRVYTTNEWSGTGIKCVKGRRIGFSGGTNEDAEKILDRSLTLMRLAPEDEAFRSLPSSGGSGSEEEVHNTEDIREIAEVIVSVAKPASVVNGVIRSTEYRIHITNSLGIDVRNSGAFTFVHLTAKEGMGEGVVKAYSSERSMDPELLGLELRENTERAEKAEAYRGKERVSALIMPDELAGLVSSTILEAVNGENVNRVRSLWSGKLGQVVSDPALTVIDDGRLVGGLRSGAVDDEGVPASRKMLIERGVLKSYIYDSYNGAIAGREPTGNGFRRSMRSVEGAHLLPARCSPSNVLVKPGRDGMKDLIDSTDLVVYKVAAPYADPFTGSFALELRNGLYHGKPVKHALLCGNMFECLKRITGISEETKNAGAVILPAIRFDGLSLVGM
jgi:PmbA protein